MHPAVYLVIFVPIWLLIMSTQRRQRHRATMVARRLNNKGETIHMLEIAKRFLNVECVVYLFDGNTISGTVTEINNSALLIKKSCGECEAINLGYVTRIREYPKNKKGKKKSVIAD